MFRWIVSSIAAVVCLASVLAASAADMAAKAPVMKAPAVGAPVWTGFYVGAVGGYGWGTTRHTNNSNGISSGDDSGLKGGLFGGTYGYNWQIGNWVIGLEGDISWSGIKDTYTSSGAFVGFCNALNPCETKLNWLGTDRARLGYAWDRYLVYATGGVAYGSVYAVINNLPAFFQAETHTRVGYAAGGGVEAKLTKNWSAKLEYIYVDLGDSRGWSAPGIAPFPTFNVLARTSTVRFGINYLFGGLL